MVIAILIIIYKLFSSSLSQLYLIKACSFNESVLASFAFGAFEAAQTSITAASLRSLPNLFYHFLWLGGALWSNAPLGGRPGRDASLQLESTTASGAEGTREDSFLPHLEFGIAKFLTT